MQNVTAQEFTLAAFLKQVAQNHPFIKQTHLKVNQAIAKILKAKGTLDPKIFLDKNQKEFQKKAYFNQNQISLKIPTRWGVAFKTFYEKNMGIFLNPTDKTPKKGLYGVGISVPLARGFLNNQRITDIKKAQLFRKQSLAKQQMMINQIFYEAIVSYVDWIFAEKNLKVYKESLENAEERLENVRKNFKAGDKSALDTLETHVFWNNQFLAYEKAKLNLIQKKIDVSNFLWSENAAPLQLTNATKVALETLQNIQNILDIEEMDWNTTLENHPKIQDLDLKSKSIALSKKLALNQMLPKIDLQYNLLSEYKNFSPEFSNEQYKWGLKISMPLFLRKQRGAFKIANYKLQEIFFEKKQVQNVLSNKAKRLQANIKSYKMQFQIAKKNAKGYEKLTQAETRKMFLGESNVFTVNYRATKSIESNLKWIVLENKLLKTYTKIFQLKAQSEINE